MEINKHIGETEYSVNLRTNGDLTVIKAEHRSLPSAVSFSIFMSRDIETAEYSVHA